MASGCLVLVDGWNHYLRTQACFEYEVAVKFPIDRLAGYVATTVGEDTVTDVAVVMAIPDRNQPGEQPQYWQWRRKLRKLAGYGVRHEAARFSYHEMSCAVCGSKLDRNVRCEACDHLNPLAGRRKEKGADVKLATMAVNAAWRQDYSSLVILAQDADYGPMARQVREIHREQGRSCGLFSAFPVCGDQAHDHRGIPGTTWLPLNAEAYEKLTALPPVDPRK